MFNMTVRGTSSLQTKAGKPGSILGGKLEEGLLFGEREWSGDEVAGALDAVILSESEVNLPFSPP